MQGARMSMLTRMLLIFLPLTFSPLTYSEPVNYCTDPKVNQEWEHLAHKNKHHPEWRSMYNLRKELCSKVKNNKLSLDEAIEQFEAERDVMIEQLRERLEEKHGKRTSKV